MSESWTKPLFYVDFYILLTFTIKTIWINYILCKVSEHIQGLKYTQKHVTKSID